jgi:asparagine synthetase B (glutamine-hydrolysing)
MTTCAQACYSAAIQVSAEWLPRGRSAAPARRQFPNRSPVSQVQYLDMKTYLVGDILTKVDRASMAHALEVRVPFLDHPTMEWVSGLPPELKLQGAEGKYMLKKALEPICRHDIMYRRKMGFSVPLAELVPGAAEGQGAQCRDFPTLAATGMFNSVTCRNWSTSPCPACATTAPPCGPC